MPKVFLGMSGGVDSSVSAALLKQQGYDVTGIYMKNWSEDLPGMKCPWAEDLADAKRVAVGLDIDFEVWDFQDEYKKRVVDYMLTEFAKGRTPNPDIMCNQEIKFKLFYDTAKERGADYIATGHYAGSGLCDASTGEIIPITSNVSRDSTPVLLRANDENKDQTYFLYRMSDEATAHTLFPLANLAKPEVKKLAADFGLDVAGKKESMGVCFVGEVGMKEFLSTYLKTQPGEIRELESSQVLGFHDGAFFYTIGQRHGLYLGGGLPYYVVKKDLKRNIVYVSRNLNDANLWTRSLTLENLHLRSDYISANLEKLDSLQVRLRHRAPLIPARFESISINQSNSKSSRNDQLHANSAATDQAHLGSTSASHSSSGSSRSDQACLTFPEEIKRPAPGQSVVFYDGEICLGGGIIAEEASHREQDNH